MRFAPWVGERYATEGFRGLRVLVVCESHYGHRRYERPTATPEVIKALALNHKHPLARKKPGRHSHFAKIMTAMHNELSASRFGSAHRADFWGRVAYYNFVQEFLPAHRVAPPPGAWARGVAPWGEVLDALQPEAILCFSLRNGERVKAHARGVPVAVVNHPSSNFAYTRVNPVVARCLEAAALRRTSASTSTFREGPVFLKWQQETRAAHAAHPAMSTIPAKELSAILATWKALMTAVDAAGEAISRGSSWLADVNASQDADSPSTSVLRSTK